MTTLTPEQLHELAEVGARTRLDELRQEIETLLGAFPNLDASLGRIAAAIYGGDSAPATADDATDRRAWPRTDPPAPPRPKGTRKRRMSAAARKAVSVRMKKYWAGRRKKGARQRPERTRSTAST